MGLPYQWRGVSLLDDFSNEQKLTRANKREGIKLKYQQRTETNKKVNCLSEDSYSFTYEESRGFSFNFTS